MKSQKTLFFSLLFSLNAFADTVTDPCGGPAALFALVDRPTVGDSACVVPYRQAVLEVGFQYAQLRPTGTGQNLPEAELRIGMPWNNEFVLLIPNYFHQSVAPESGFGPSTVGVKHEFGYTSQAVWTAEALFTLPSGSSAFGSHGLGAAVNGILAYNFTQQLTATGMLGVSSETQPGASGGQRFTSVNPDLVVSWLPVPVFEIYGEVYGQSNTSPYNGWGANFDGGIVYLLRSWVTVDVEIGQRLAGNLGGFNRYVGAGFAVFL